MTEHTILVAFTVQAHTREYAEQALLKTLPAPGTPVTTHLVVADHGTHTTGQFQLGLVESWWVAEDDRRDGSDNDSAVFVEPGRQRQASRLLFGVGLTDNLVEYGHPRWDNTYEES